MRLFKTTDCMSGADIYYTKDTDLTIYTLTGKEKAYELWSGDSKYREEPYRTLAEAVDDMERVYNIIKH